MTTNKYNYYFFLIRIIISEYTEARIFSSDNSRYTDLVELYLFNNNSSTIIIQRSELINS